MFKRLLCLILCFIFAFAVGCSKKPTGLSVDEGEVSSVVSEPEIIYGYNNLTGLKNINPEAENNRPVAIMVNNISVAQKVQTGLYGADIIYETEVEGGVTRLLAVYKDISNIEKIGTVRSARYVYIDLAMGHNAIYVHHGQDGAYAAPHLKDCNHFTVAENGNGGVRTKNGLAREHTLYAVGADLWNILKSKFDYKTDNNVSWQKFAAEEETVTLGNVANTVTIPMSHLSKSVFKYDTTTQKYIRFSGTTERKDYLTGESLYVKNVFLLNTSITDYPDGYHRKVDLNSGSGYYFVNGTYTPINWSKGSASSPIKFTNTDGTELTVAPGNSWVCIGKNSVTPSMQ